MEINASLVHKPGSYIRAILSVVYSGRTARADAERRLANACYRLAAELTKDANTVPDTALAVDARNGFVALEFRAGADELDERDAIECVRAALAATGDVAFNRTSNVDRTL